jgi:hypothetical protein
MERGGIGEGGVRREVPALHARHRVGVRYACQSRQTYRQAMRLSHSRFRVSLEGDDSVGGQAQEFESRGLENEKESIARSHGKKISLILHKYQRHACVEERGELGVRCGML